MKSSTFCLMRVHNPKNNLRWKFQYYPDDSHGSVLLKAGYDAIQFIFTPYTIHVSMMHKIREPSFNADSAIITHFKATSDYMGYKIIPPEQFVNEIAYAMMRNNEMDRSFKLFDLNICNYPESHQAYNGMGDYFMTNKDK